MNIAGLTTCVNYSPYLQHSLRRWLDTLDSLLVVTAPDDTATLELCERYELKPFVTDVFTRGGADFNKGAAMAEAFDSVHWSDWVLFFDADILPPADWRKLTEPKITPGRLYGTFRELESGDHVAEGDIAGYFHLFHASDKNAQPRPIVETCWSHAGNYDTEFQNRWLASERTRLPISVTHLGLPFQNWCGIGKEDKLRQIIRDRKKHGGDWHHEHI